MNDEAEEAGKTVRAISERRETLSLGRAPASALKGHEMRIKRQLFRPGRRNLTTASFEAPLLFGLSTDGQGTLPWLAQNLSAIFTILLSVVLIAALATLALAIVVPWFFFDWTTGRHSGFVVAMLSQIGIMVIFALSYNMLMGQAGLLSFGHGVLLGLGGYVDRSGGAALGGITYLQFLAPGLLAATVMQAAARGAAAVAARESRVARAAALARGRLHPEHFRALRP